MPGWRDGSPGVADHPVERRGADRRARNCGGPLAVDPTLTALRSTTDAARLEEQIGPAFGLPGELYVVVADGPDLEALLQTNELLIDRLHAELPTLGVQPPSRLLPSKAAQRRTLDQIDGVHLSADSIRGSLEQARLAAGFAPGAFDPFVERVPALLDPHQQLSYDDYVQHDVADPDQSIRRSRRRRTAAGHLCVPDRRAGFKVESIVQAVDDRQTLRGCRS